MAYLTFPEHNRQDYKGRIIFEAKREITSTLGETAFNVGEFFGASGNAGQAGPDDGFRGATADITTYESPEVTYEPRGAISLYLPQSLQFNDRVNYADADLGAMGGAAFNAIRGGQSGMDYFKGAGAALGSQISSFGDAMTSGLQSEAAQLVALRLASVSSGLQGAVETATGVTLNPNRLSTMRDVPIRNFQFTFKLIPTSATESRVIDAIIKFFRAEMYPESRSAAGVPVAFRFPSKFQIKMLYDNKKVGTGILPCFLESVNIVYNPNNMAFHTDGNPQEIDLTLVFREERALSKQDIINMSGSNPVYDAMVANTRTDRYLSTGVGGL